MSPSKHGKNLQEWEKKNFQKFGGAGSIIKSANQSGMKYQSLRDIASLHKAFDRHMINMDCYTVPRAVTPSPISVLMIAEGWFDVGNVGRPQVQVNDGLFKFPNNISWQIWANNHSENKQANVLRLLTWI